MKRKVEWSPAAQKEFGRHMAYLVEQSPAASRLVNDRVQDAVNRLSDLHSGRKGRVQGTFELYVSKTSLIIVYEFVSDGSLTILRIVHASRDFKPGQFPPAD